MQYNTSSRVEPWFRDLHPDFSLSDPYRKIHTLVVENYVELGQLAALRFLEWVCLNPGGIIALPTGKTPEFFIKWVLYYLENWAKELNNGILARIGFRPGIRPDLKSLYFFQLDEFFPINPEHERSFTYFVRKFYLEGFGLDAKKARLINTFELTEHQQKSIGNIATLDRVFTDGIIDLTLRIKKPTSEKELLKQKTIRIFDQFCQDYEEDIRAKGGIGFFMGGIGPDGHVAFNVRGSSHHSHTRLTNINYETQAAAAADLGGIEGVRKKAVITIGLETITFNPAAVAIILAAGQSKADVVARALEKEASLEDPASSLQKLPCARFFITQSAAASLTLGEKNTILLFEQKKLPDTFPEKLLMEECERSAIALREIPRMYKDPANSLPDTLRIASQLSQKPVTALAEDVVKQLAGKIEKGLALYGNERFLHTAPHHDDIELAYFPLLHHLVRSATIENHFCYCTSGFTAVTNQYVLDCLEYLMKLLSSGDLEKSKSFSSLAEADKGQDDITGYLNGIALQDMEMQHFHRAARLTRLFFQDLKSDDPKNLYTFLSDLVTLLKTIEPGRKEPELVQTIKGWLREFEAELVWAHFGIDMDHVSHLRLHFYSGDIFPEYPDFDQDVMPIVRLLERIKPTVVTLALDPEGSGPDTHYKTLIAIAEAIDKYMDTHADKKIRIWGYRNVWSRWQLHEVNTIIPVSLNSFAVLHNMFTSCFQSQKSASFPSYELDGTFSELAQKIWVEQHNQLVNLLGKEYFYDSTSPMLRRAYGAIFLKDMSYDEFTESMIPVRNLLKAKEKLKPDD
ncbi:MAG: glucosamine/galactosamine-6-phosphate isomerase [Bacteroidetes bacterium]|nr:glucosamine/galactosamine-6-phosphate isomerase [Bacteroidota bacterium]